MGSLLRRVNFLNLARNIRKYSDEKTSYWLWDNKPGPYPKTEEERIQAAKKYGLLREEYEPFPDDGDGYGDYPKTLIQPQENLDWNYQWTDSIYKRDFGDPIHPDAMFYTYMRISDPPTRMSPWLCLFFFLLPITIIAVLTQHPFFTKYILRHRIMEKQMPQPGVVHYTFETVD